MPFIQEQIISMYVQTYPAIWKRLMIITPQVMEQFEKAGFTSDMEPVDIKDRKINVKIAVKDVSAGWCVQKLQV